MLESTMDQFQQNYENYAYTSSKVLGTVKSKRVLIIDDEIDVRLALADMLVTEGYKVATARNGADALDYLKSRDELPDLIILDINMPVKDGLEFRYDQRRMADLNHIPIVMMSGDIERRNGAPDIEAFIAKPFERQDVLNAIALAHA